MNNKDFFDYALYYFGLGMIFGVFMVIIGIAVTNTFNL